MVVRRRSHFLLIKETYHNGLVGTVLAGLGGLGTIVGVAGLISSQLVSDIPKYTWVIFLFVVLFGSFLIRIPRFRGRFAFEPGLWSIELNVGDLFEQESGIVVTVDRRLSLDLDQTGPDSLVSQLVGRLLRPRVPPSGGGPGHLRRRAERRQAGRLAPLERV